MTERAGRVLGVGGFFFRAKASDALAEWYQDMLGVQMTPETYEDAPWRTEAGTTVFQPFSEGKDYFGERNIGWMINFRVDDLDVIIERLRAHGHKVEYEGDGKAFPNGRFAKLHDPEGNAIQLWEPGGLDPG
ncbi:MAG: VOC family protein [Pseudomonadota bacterium]